MPTFKIVCFVYTKKQTMALDESVREGLFEDCFGN